MTKGNTKWDIAMAKAKKRDRNFVISYVGSRTLPWPFKFMNVRYTMTCTMDTVLMTLFILWHQKYITHNALKKDTSQMKQIVKLIDSCDYDKASYTFVDFNLNCKTYRLYKAEKKTTPSNVQLQSMMLPATIPCFNCMVST